MRANPLLLSLRELLLVFERESSISLGYTRLLGILIIDSIPLFEWKTNLKKGERNEEKRNYLFFIYSFHKHFFRGL